MRRRKRGRHLDAGRARPLPGDLGRHYMLGDALTLADIPLGTHLYRYFNIDIERPRVPHVEAWHRRLEERPAYRQHVMVFGRPIAPIFKPRLECLPSGLRYPVSRTDRTDADPKTFSREERRMVRCQMAASSIAR